MIIVEQNSKKTFSAFSSNVSKRPKYERCQTEPCERINIECCFQVSSHPPRPSTKTPTCLTGHARLPNINIGSAVRKVIAKVD